MTKKKFKNRLEKMPLWRRVGFFSKPAEFALYLLSISGLILWDVIGFDWMYVRFSLFVHVISALVLFSIFVIPFWISHRQTYTKSTRINVKNIGRIIDYLLALALVSGVYLLFIGNRGDDVGTLSYWVHLAVAIPLTALVVAHAYRYTMLRKKRWLLSLALSIFILFAGAHAFAAETSSSFIISNDKSKIYSANFNAGSLSIIDKESGDLIVDKQLGKDIRRIALNEKDNLLLATDYLDNKAYILDSKTLDIQHVVNVGKRPFGTVYDATNKRFWVSIFEESKIIAISINGKIIETIITEETPRGLALLSDGRLLVSHAMVGKVSIIDSNNIEQPKIIQLHSTQNADEFVSQGVPRQLDDIAISPDETEAWLPHLLWNFDHEFQFQSTIFPTVSLLSLEAGNEQELTERRKHLFEQINIIEDGTRTRIVSNPHDAEFSADGNKLYVTLAASEDIMVFDLSRRSVGKKRSTRRAGKKNQGGAKVTQIYRHVAGDNPRGLLIDGSNLYTQNVMSLDIDKFNTGGNSSFSKLTLSKAAFTKLTVHDALDKDARSGARLFNNGNRDDFLEAPMAGDFWMSCNSCHLDGFNFTNQYLFRDNPVDATVSAITGHKNLKNMISGNFTGDYIRIIKDTQGGMGTDQKNHVDVVTDPDNPSEPTMQMMKNLHKFVNLPHNLPFTASWLKSDAKKYEDYEWINSAQCATCHSDMFDQWADSNHRLMGQSNPYYVLSENLAAEMEGEEFRQWCMGCHSPQALTTGRLLTEGTDNMFEQGGASLKEALDKDHPTIDEGTSCLFCHRITEIEDAHGKGFGGNASMTINLRDRETVLGEASTNSLMAWLGDKQINAKPEVHAQSYKNPLYSKSQICATCHNEFSPGTGATIVNTYKEWEESHYNTPDNPALNRTCLDCHMHADVNRIGEPIVGISTDGGISKENVRTHTFTGANHHQVGLRNKKLEKQSIALLKLAGDIEILPFEKSDTQFTVRIKNTGTGHHLPTGVSDLRQFWVQVLAKDRSGKVVYSNDGYVPEDSRFLRKVFGDKDGVPVGLAFWRYETLLEDTRIPAGQHRDEVYNIPEGLNIAYIEAEFKFRTFPKKITMMVQKVSPKLPFPPILTLKSAVRHAQ
jgi:DNA-binding beta-propeller fold protein YncE